MKSSYIIKQFAGTLLFFAILFLSAGRLDYWQGLVYVLLGLLMFILSHTLLRIDPELQQERSRPGADIKKWDKTILGLSFLATIGMFVTAGLDSGRFHCSPTFPLSLSITGIVLTAAGQLLFLIAQKQNRFFSSTVRIQSERGHQICDTGLYRIVRHPAYLGSFIQALGFPLFFGSLWSLIPAGVSILLILIRTALEDRTLREELNGYREYTNITKHRLIPGIW